MRYVLILLGLLFAGVANAMECEKVPDCASLGYSKNKDPNCADNGYMYCPFDQNYKVCVQYNCKALGFTESDKSSWCADLIECKGNEKMTLCQKPCFATKYEELKDLAESGKCKLITMKSDITIPANQDITLAKNTTLDGGGYTLNTNETKLTLDEGSKLQNLNIHRKIASSKALTLIIVTGASTFEDVSILDENNNNVVENSNWRLSCTILSVLTVRGNLKIEVKNDVRHPIFNRGQLVFENAKVELISPSNSSDVFTHQSNIIVKNSEIHIKTSSQALNTVFPELTNSQMIIDLQGGGRAFYKDTGENCGIKLGEGSTLDTKTSTLTSTPMVEIILNGKADNPATAIIQEESASTNLNVQNTAAKLIYNGKTYTPTQNGTTVLKDVETSTNWKKEQ